jgi:hypothetical protein
MSVVFDHLGVFYEMTAEEIEAAYRYQQRQYRLEDAERQFLLFVYGCDPGELNHGELEYQEFDFEERYGVSVSDGLAMLDAFVDRYEDLMDCNVAENDTWRNAIQEELADRKQ